MCTIDFDPLYNAQDFGDDDLKVTIQEVQTDPSITDEDLENDLGVDPEALRELLTAFYETFIGGDRMVRFSTELRFPIYSALRGVTFFDAGGTWLNEVGFDIDNMREGAGLGLRLNTPVGAVRLEYAWKLDRRPGESMGRWYFTIGSAF